jgi:hypothetical protein
MPNIEPYIEPYNSSIKDNTPIMESSTSTHYSEIHISINIQGHITESSTITHSEMHTSIINEESINEESINEESINEESINEESINEESINEESINEESINEEFIPCDICEELILITNYINHASQCLNLNIDTILNSNESNGNTSTIQIAGEYDPPDNNPSNNDDPSLDFLNNIINILLTRNLPYMNQTNIEENIEEMDSSENIEVTDTDESDDQEILEATESTSDAIETEIDINLLHTYNTLEIMNTIDLLDILLSFIENVQRINLNREQQNTVSQSPLINLGRFANIDITSINRENITEYDLNLLIQQIMGGNIKIGVSNILNTLSPCEYNLITKEDNCMICLESLFNMVTDNANGLDQSYDKVPMKTLCKHIFCRECITKWFITHTKCPNCNADQNELLEKIEKDD